MGTKLNPGNYDCYAHADPDEPLFILLGRDRNAELLVRLWAVLRQTDRATSLIEDKEKIAEARSCAAEMRHWLEHNRYTKSQISHSQLHKALMGILFEFERPF